MRKQIGVEKKTFVPMMGYFVLAAIDILLSLHIGMGKEGNEVMLALYNLTLSN